MSHIFAENLRFFIFFSIFAGRERKKCPENDMIDQNVSLELMQFIETNILPQYNNFGRSHGIQHVQRVIERSLQLAKTIGADVNMAYAVAAYHDIGMSGPRAIHHVTGGKILAADQRLRKWFSEQQIVIMREAVEDHRASLSHAPRSIYGKIVAEADRDLSPEVVLTRTVQFGLENYPEKGKEEQWERFAEHMQNKYSSQGYITLWIPNSPNEQHLRDLRNIIADKKRLREEFERIYAEQLTIEH